MAAFLSSAATVIIFEERFYEGAWTYFVFLPILYIIFTYFRHRLGQPTSTGEALGRLTAERKYLKPFQRESWTESKTVSEHLRGSRRLRLRREGPSARPLPGSFLCGEGDTRFSGRERETGDSGGPPRPVHQRKQGSAIKNSICNRWFHSFKTDGLEADYSDQPGPGG